MAKAQEKAKPEAAAARQAIQVERRDFAEIVAPTGATKPAMAGFDPVYADIVDYIVRCTHRIWDERDVGLIHSHYTHNCVVYTPLGTSYDRETIHLWKLKTII